MITYKKIETLEELDEILPLVSALHNSQNYCRLFPHSAFLAWLALAFRTPLMGVWVCYESNSFDSMAEPIGYIIVSIEDVFTTREALLFEAFADFKDVEIKKEMLNDISIWAFDNGCRRFSMYTENEKVRDTMVKRYGFKLSRYHLIKEI